MQRIVSAVLLLAFAATARAQVNVEVVFEQDQFLRSDAAPLQIRISNFSGQSLRLSNAQDWLAFTVTGEDGKALRQFGPMPATKPFTIESAKTVALRADLMPFFDLSAAGRYGVSVTARFPQLELEVKTEPKKFDIISGVKVYEKEVGVPGTTPPVVRKYALQQAAFFKESRLYARVTDVAESTFVRIVPLGGLVSFSKPVAAVDNSSQLHVLFQNGQRSFSYAIVAPDGEQLIQQTHEIVGNSRPSLRAESDGRIMVSGGARKVSPDDLPPSPRLSQTNGVAELK